MPGKQHVVREWLGERAVKIDHHLGNALLRRCDAPIVGTEAKLTPDRRLNAGPIEDLALDLGGGQRLGAHGLDDQLVSIFGPEMLDCPDTYARLDKELLLGFHEAGFIPDEIRPIRLLPIPDHER